MSDQATAVGLIPDFEIALWGYDREQVDRCLYDLTGRLEEALAKLDSMELLQHQLCEARVELDQLRGTTGAQERWPEQLAEIMQAAEELRRRAEKQAGRSAATAGKADGTAPEPSGSTGPDQPPRGEQKQGSAEPATGPGRGGKRRRRPRSAQ